MHLFLANMYISDECPNRSWYYIYGHCVKVSTGKYTRSDALTNCRKMGGDLYRPYNSADLYQVPDIINAIWAIRV